MCTLSYLLNKSRQVWIHKYQFINFTMTDLHERLQWRLDVGGTLHKWNITFQSWGSMKMQFLGFSCWNYHVKIRKKHFYFHGNNTVNWFHEIFFPPTIFLHHYFFREINILSILYCKLISRNIFQKRKFREMHPTRKNSVK